MSASLVGSEMCIRDRTRVCRASPRTPSRSSCRRGSRLRCPLRSSSSRVPPSPVCPARADPPRRLWLLLLQEGQGQHRHGQPHLPEGVRVFVRPSGKDAGARGLRVPGLPLVHRAPRLHDCEAV
eukprot:14429135-Alexandrium_andersonii.AAC.1